MNHRETSAFVLCDYELCEVTLERETKKSMRVRYPNGYVSYVPKNKCCLPDEKICVVWERWRGCNGRGAYRLERESDCGFTHPAFACVARDWPHQGWVPESAPGVVDATLLSDAIERIGAVNAAAEQSGPSVW